jgi:SAM-dependent methyltransferase
MLYKNLRVETMPRYNENLDSDSQEELDKRKISADDGKKFLDLGTGPATHAIMLSKRGFIVVGSDLSEAAINRARKVYPNHPNVNFIVDDILKQDSKMMNLTISLIEAVSMFFRHQIEKNTSTKYNKY